MDLDEYEIGILLSLVRMEYRRTLRKLKRGPAYWAERGSVFDPTRIESRLELLGRCHVDLGGRTLDDENVVNQRPR